MNRICSCGRPLARDNERGICYQCRREREHKRKGEATMNEDERRTLVEKPRGTYTFMGEIATVAGCKNPYASVSTCLPGFYRASWEEIKRALESDGVIEQARWHSGVWLGCKG